LQDHLVLPEVDDKALAGLKFSEALPRHLAVATLSTRLADLEHAASVLAEPIRFERYRTGLVRLTCPGRT
jgi:ATP-dependent helicase Lhr and Lhr-like helicase